MTRKILLVLALLTAANPAIADSLKTLEHERATTIRTMLNPDLDNEQRARSLEKAKRRLVDLERMVLREDQSDTRTTPAVRTAFANYDLTFLIHAASENELTIFDQWFDQLGLSSDAIMAATPRRR